MRSAYESVVVVVRAWRDDDGLRAIVRSDAFASEIPVRSLDELCSTVRAACLLLEEPSADSEPRRW